MLTVGVGWCNLRLRPRPSAEVAAMRACAWPNITRLYTTNTVRRREAAAPIFTGTHIVS